MNIPRGQRYFADARQESARRRCQAYCDTYGVKYSFISAQVGAPRYLIQRFSTGERLLRPETLEKLEKYLDSVGA